MFTPRVRIVIIALCLLLLCLCLYKEKIWAGIVISSFAIFTILGYFFQGTVYLSFRQMREGKIALAKETLSLTKYFNTLTKTQKGYYFFTKGYIALAEKNMIEAETAFNHALNVGLRLKSDQAMALANLGIIANDKKNKTEAREFLKKAKNLKISKNVALELDKINQIIG